MFKSSLFLPMLIAAAATVSSCGKAVEQQASSLVAARVNGSEILMHRVESSLARGNDIAPAAAGHAAARVLERIIDQELLVQEALKTGLDRVPQVAQAVEEARRQILARAYLERVMTAAALESPRETRAFYKENPALFERRRIYRVHELMMFVPPGQLDALETEVAAAKSLQDFAGRLKSRDLPFHAAMYSRPAEQIPMNILPRVAGMRDGQLAVFPGPRGASVVQLLESRSAPLSEQQAAPLIERYLLNRRRLDAARTEVWKLRQQARIEYVGAFAATRAAMPTRSHLSSAAASGQVSMTDASGRLMRE